MTENTEKATFAAGCFWGIEHKLSLIDGVISTRVGYTGGNQPEPDYEEVCSGKTGHAEAVEIVFNPEKTSYTILLEAFWAMHNPTTLNRQGFDIGSQYRSVIFYHTEEQRRLAVESKNKLEESGKYKTAVVTEIIPAEKFWPAEEYHQQYYKKAAKNGW